MRRWFCLRGIPQRPLGSLILRYVERVIGHRFDDIAPIATIRRLHCPVLLAWRGGCNRAGGRAMRSMPPADRTCSSKDRGWQPRRLRGSGARTAGAGGFFLRAAVR